MCPRARGRTGLRLIESRCGRRSSIRSRSLASRWRRWRRRRTSCSPSRIRPTCSPGCARTRVHPAARRTRRWHRRSRCSPGRARTPARRAARRIHRWHRYAPCSPRPACRLRHWAAVCHTASSTSTPAERCTARRMSTLAGRSSGYRRASWGGCKQGRAALARESLRWRARCCESLTSSFASWCSRETFGGGRAFTLN
jgi:hypothetical protein